MLPILIRLDLAGGGIENWFAYMLALVFLLFRPQGLFGETHHRARCDLRRCASLRAMLYREAGQFKTSLRAPTRRSSRSRRTAGS